VRHLAATPVGRLVSGEAEVTKVDGRQIEFAVQATDGAKEIGVGSGGVCHSALRVRELQSVGHEVRLMAAQYGKAYVQRNKNDAADAAAICEAAGRPTMRFVAIRTADQQATHCCTVAAKGWFGSAPAWSMRCGRIWPSSA
jgi:transposase